MPSRPAAAAAAAYRRLHLEDGCGRFLLFCGVLTKSAALVVGFISSRSPPSCRSGCGLRAFPLGGPSWPWPHPRQQPTCSPTPKAARWFLIYFLFCWVRASTKTTETHRATPVTPRPAFLACRWATTPQRHVPGVRCCGPSPGFKKRPPPNHGRPAWRHKAARVEGKTACSALCFTGVSPKTPRVTAGHTQRPTSLRFKKWPTSKTASRTQRLCTASRCEG